MFGRTMLGGLALLYTFGVTLFNKKIKLIKALLSRRAEKSSVAVEQTEVADGQDICTSVRYDAYVEGVFILIRPVPHLPTQSFCKRFICAGNDLCRWRFGSEGFYMQTIKCGASGCRCELQGLSGGNGKAERIERAEAT